MKRYEKHLLKCFPGTSSAVSRHNEVWDGEQEVHGDERTRDVGVQTSYMVGRSNKIRQTMPHSFFRIAKCISCISDHYHIGPPCGVLVDDGHRHELLSDHSGQRQVRLEGHSQHDESGDGRVEESVRQRYEEAAQAAPALFSIVEYCQIPEDTYS